LGKVAVISLEMPRNGAREQRRFGDGKLVAEKASLLRQEGAGGGAGGGKRIEAGEVRAVRIERIQGQRYEETAHRSKGA
jgi:hypothetical protein